MILPTALVERWPLDTYKQQNDSIESALKHINQDTVNLYKEIEKLKEESLKVEPVEFPANYEDLSKEERWAIKRIAGPNSLRGKLDNEIAAKEEHLLRLIKYNDYPAMIMAAYPESRLMNKSNYWNEYQKIEGPILIRGIANYKLGLHHKQIGKDYYFIETGYLGNYPSPNNRTGRKIYHRIVKNAMQHTSIMNVPDDRWKKLVSFNPSLEYKGWKKSGSKILIVLSTQKPFQAYGDDQEKWLDNVIKTIKENTDREIVFREKNARNERTTDTIYNALDNDIYAVVTYNSIAAVEAIQYGIPAFALAPTAADPVGNKDLRMIERPIMPDEEIVKKWLHSLAYSQFSLNEIITGDAWKLVLENEERETINY